MKKKLSFNKRQAIHFLEILKRCKKKKRKIKYWDLIKRKE